MRATTRCSRCRSRLRVVRDAASCLSSLRGARPFTDDDLELARSQLAQAARGALERSELYEAERNARALAQQLARTGSLLATELDPEAVLEEVVAACAEPARSRRVRRSGCSRATSSSSAPRAVTGRTRLLGDRAPASGWLSGDVSSRGLPSRWQTRGRTIATSTPMPSSPPGTRAYLGVPLIGPEGTSHGVLARLLHASTHLARGRDRGVARTRGEHLGGAANAELYPRVALERERSDAILANIADGIVAVDRDGRCRALERRGRADHRRSVGRGTRPHDSRGPAADRSSPRASAARQRLVSIRRGGEEVWLSLTEAVMRDPPGAVAGPHLRVPRHLGRPSSSR